MRTPKILFFSENLDPLRILDFLRILYFFFRILDLLDRFGFCICVSGFAFVGDFFYDVRRATILPGAGTLRNFRTALLPPEMH